MQYFAGELLSSKNILLRFEADEKVKKIKLPMITRKNFYLIFKEAINNAYKYSCANTVAVSISEDANKLRMIISDDGKGFDFSANNANGKGNGLNNMQLRAKEINAQLTIAGRLE